MLAGAARAGERAPRESASSLFSWPKSRSGPDVDTNLAALEPHSSLSSAGEARMADNAGVADHWSMLVIA